MNVCRANIVIAGIQTVLVVMLLEFDAVFAAWQCHQRPKRMRFGDRVRGLEVVEGSRGTYIATLVERQSRFVIIVKVPDKQTENVVAALIKAVRKLPVALRRSLTWDRGTELANHAQFTVATDVQVYFCDPSSPWQRGSNENTNGLLRQYYPKGADLSDRGLVPAEGFA